ncbi:MAG: thioredoxin domain-containing protein [Acidobacteria bacterium]|nr:thioredoxin domain-containing protein [Acidobacteriota bacterium]
MTKRRLTAMARRSAIILLALGSLVVAVGAFLRQKAEATTVISRQKGAVSSDAREGEGARWSFGGPLPGATPFDEALLRKLQAARAGRPAGERPRTRHLNPDGSPKYTNRLYLETSPYLRQHAHNPVNWYSWGDEAFDAARRLHRPVLLSVGYSTCHWCHVMEEESFENEEIARYLNENYVAIKVDREERPDVDAVYMSAVQMLTGGGGWPMTVAATPDRKPFFGGTYFPPAKFKSLLAQLRKAYDSEPDRVAQAAEEITLRIQQNMSQVAPMGIPDASALSQAADYYRSRFDSGWGGMRGGMKFPSSLPVRFLLRLYRRTRQEDLLRMATLTLDRMAAGGMHDQVGGGFHRYSTDQQWLVPHFEKMLYDNALLAMAYLEAYQVTGEKRYAEISREILQYAERDMTSPEGAFYSATDADSPAPSGKREEGWFFTWTPDEVEYALGPERARIVGAWFDVTPSGNFEGRNILHTGKPLGEVARALGLPPEKLRATIEESREILYEARSRRPPPLRDEKILTAWNGLMISAHARAALVLGDPRYAQKAERAAEFLLQKLRKGERLYRSFKDGRAQHDAYLDDYAFLAAGLLDLFEATGNLRWLREAISLDRVVERHYEDRSNGGFFLTADDHERLLARERPSYDGAEPAGSSVEILNLLRLSELTTNEAYRKRAEHAFIPLGGVLRNSPAALSEALLALDFLLDSAKEIVIVTNHSRAEAEPLLAQLRTTYVPNRVLLVAAEGPALKELARLSPLVESKAAGKNQPMAYVCKRGVCDLPTTDPAVFEKQIRRVDPLPVTTGR